MSSLLQRRDFESLTGLGPKGKNIMRKPEHCLDILSEEECSVVRLKISAAKPNARALISNAQGSRLHVQRLDLEEVMGFQYLRVWVEQKLTFLGGIVYS